MVRHWIYITVGLTIIQGCHGDGDTHNCPEDGQFDHCTTGCCAEDDQSRNLRMECCSGGMHMDVTIGISVAVSVVFVIAALTVAYCYFKHKHRQGSPRSVSPDLSDAAYIETNPYPNQGKAELFMFHLNTGRHNVPQSPPPAYKNTDLANEREDSVVTPPPALTPLRSSQSENSINEDSSETSETKDL